MIRALPFTATTRDKQSSQAQLPCEILTPQKRMFFALRNLSIWWVGAIVAVFIPILHFVLVPAFVILGIATAAPMLKASAILQGGEIPCPQCQTPVPLNRRIVKGPFQESCPKCRFQMQIDANHSIASTDHPL